MSEKRKKHRHNGGRIQKTAGNNPCRLNQILHSDSILYFCDIHRCQLLFLIFQAGYQRFGCIQGGKNSDAGLYGMTADDKTIAAF